VSKRGVGFSFGFPVTAEMQEAITSLRSSSWRAAIEEDGARRPGAFVAEVTKLIDLRRWPKGSRVIVRRERPHPGAQLSLFDTIQGFRHTAFIFAPPEGRPRERRSMARLELRHRQHARVEDRIRQGKAAGLKNLPCAEAEENDVWLECVLAAADLVCWSKLICFADDEELARCEIAAFRYRILHMAARITRSGRVQRLRLDRSWSWAKTLALARVPGRVKSNVCSAAGPPQPIPMLA
jgi:hypothetical protein